MKGVMFDLFGTLCVRTQPEIKIIERFGLSPEIRDKLEWAVCGYKFDNWENYLDNISKVTGVQDKEGIKEIIMSCNRRGIEGIHLKAGKVLEELCDSYRLGLVSSANPMAEKIVERLPDVFSAVTLSFKVGLIKQTPEIYRIHLKETGVKEACMIGDSLKSDILMSRKAGYGKGVLIGKEKGDWVTVSDLSQVPEAIRSGKAW